MRSSRALQLRVIRTVDLTHVREKENKTRVLSLHKAAMLRRKTLFTVIKSWLPTGFRSLGNYQGPLMYDCVKQIDAPPWHVAKHCSIPVVPAVLGIERRHGKPCAHLSLNSIDLLLIRGWSSGRQIRSSVGSRCIQ